MTFLSPALMAVLLPLLALPIVIHLLNRGFPRHFRFPSIELIRQTLAQRSKWHRWRHWILLALRTAALVLLLLAFLRPVLNRFGSDPAAAAERHVLIVLDHSASMEHTGDGPASRDRAVHEALKLVDSLDAADFVNILLLEPNPATCFVAFSKDHAEAKRFLRQLKPGFGRGDVNLANQVAGRLLAKHRSRPEIYFISDFQRKNWADANFTPLPPEAKLFFVDVAPARNGNAAILDARFLQGETLAGDTVPLEILLGNFGSEPFSGRVTVTLDRHLSMDHDAPVAAWSEGKVIVPVPAGAPGLHLCEVRLPADALACDNRFCLTLAVLEKEEVLIVTDAGSGPKSAAYFLEAAINPFEHQGGSLLPHVATSAEITPARLAGVRTMFITGINRLDAATAEAAGKFVFHGGGLVYFLDGPADPENLAALEGVLGPNTIPLRLARRHSATNLLSGTQQIARGDFKSRYLKLFQGATRQDLALLEFYDYYQAGATSAGGVLLTYTDESPAMAEVHHGLGTILLLNFSAGEFSSNLARQRLFPAWIQDLIKAVATREPAPASWVFGETLHAEIWRSEMAHDLTGPSGAALPVRRELAGERCALTFTPQQLGFYTLGTPRPLYAFGINTSPDEADLRPIDKELLPREFAAGHQAHFVSGAADFEELAKGRPVFHWFILAALAVLLLETAFQTVIRR